MQYIIMFLIVVGLAGADVLSGLLKARITGEGYDSSIMRVGLYHKALELLVMIVAIGLEIGLTLLGAYYDTPELAAFAGAVTAIIIFLYIAVMEVISIMENYAQANPDAAFARRIIGRLRKLNHTENREKTEEDKDGH